MSNECLFCKIVDKQIPATVIFENDRILAFRDINAQAPTHILIIPKIHIETINDLTEDNKELIGELILTAASLAKEEGVAESGYRTVFNCNRDAGQAVFHIHLHLFGGRKMSWPPG